MINNIQNSADLNKIFSIKSARDFAIKAHGEQQLSDGKPYLVHLDKVVDQLLIFGFCPIQQTDLFIAAYLHDVVEDTTVTLDEIEASFGPLVREVVYRVTDEPGANRKERKLKTYPKIKGLAVPLKLADRIANVTYSNDPKFLEMYRNEQPEFEAQCRTKDYNIMWVGLNMYLDRKS